jgi:hypothetical protein
MRCTHLVQHPDRLQPANDLFYPFPFLLTNRVAGMSRRPAITHTHTVSRVLYRMEHDLLSLQILDERLRSVVFIAFRTTQEFFGSLQGHTIAGRTITYIFDMYVTYEDTLWALRTETAFETPRELMNTPRSPRGIAFAVTSSTTLGVTTDKIFGNLAWCVTKKTLMRYAMEHTHPTAGSRCKNSDSGTPGHWQVLAVTAFICLGLASECLGFTANPTTLTFDAIQGETNLPDETLSVSRTRSNKVTLSASDNASWLTVSPATTSMTSTAQLTVTANTSALAPGTYNATITIKVGKKVRTKVPVFLTVSASVQPPPSATLSWNPVTDPNLDGYIVHVGTASGLYTKTIPVGNLTSYTMDSLSTGTTYFFAVTSHNEAGESQPSNEVRKSVY